MSKILRNTTSAPRVLIGERHYDPDLEARAEQTLGELFPIVEVVTTNDGGRQIRIEEVFKMGEIHHQQVQQARQEGHDAGYKSGYDKGLSEGLLKAREVLKNFDGAIKDAVEQRIAMLEEAKHRILDLVIQVSRKVTFDSVEIDPETTAVMISRVINQLIDKSRLKIKVNPDHLPIVEQCVDQFLTGSSAIKELAIEADPRVRFGGCFIETPSGDIDARLESQFEVMEQVIKSGEEDR